jgi:heme exporter protein D
VTTAWLQIALAFLKLVNLILDTVQERRAHQAGVDEEIARESAKVLQKTEFAKKALEHFNANSGSADEFLRSLEPK